MKGIFRQLIAILFISIIGIACTKDDFGRATSKNEQGQTEEFRILSVTSSGDGEEIKLNLSLKVDEGNELRARIFPENNIGEIGTTPVAATERVHLILRRKGDPTATTYATVEIAGRNGTVLSFEGLRLTLPEGVTIGNADEWYLTGVLGGDAFSLTNGKLTMGSNTLSANPVILPTRSDRSVEVPFAFPWTKLTVISDKELKMPQNDQVTFRPLGTLLRLNFYSNLLDDFTTSQINITTNALRPMGSFDAMSYSDAELAGQFPKWTPAEAEATPSVKTWSYKLSEGGSSPYQSLVIPAGAGSTNERSVYIWAMPTNVEDANTNTSISIDVRKGNDTTSETTKLTTYSKTAHRALKAGASYRLSNVLTSDLIISEVYYQLVAPNTNGEQANTNRNYSIVEIYNPTATEVDLSEYSIVRIVDYNNAMTYFRMGQWPDGVFANAATQPLSAVGTANNDNNFRRLYGTASAKLAPGKTLLIGAGGYVATTHKPGKNIELYNDAVRSGSLNATDATAIRAFEKKYYPRAGMQIDSAFAKGYVGQMVALDNGVWKDQHSRPGGNNGVLQLGNGQGIALVKSVGGQRTIIDITAPIGDGAEVSAYRTNILNQINAAVPTSERLASLSPELSMSYSIVRKASVGAPSSTYKANEWEVSASENDGIKSLGTRSYVAGLTPFAMQYTGYTNSNNPKSNPFWATAATHTAASKNWSTLPNSGENTPMYNLASSLVERYEEVPVSSGSASQGAIRTTSGGFEFEKSFDGNYNTSFHSNDGGAGGAKFPAELTWNLQQAEKLEYILFTPHNQQGSFDKFDIIFTYEDGTKAKVYSEEALGAPTAPVRLSWDGINSRKVKSVTFNVRKTGYVTIGIKEMEFFKQKDGYFDPTTYFTDLSCSELKSGVTYEQIMAVENAFYRELMRKLYQKTYDKEFRVTTRSILVNPDTERNHNKTQYSYSRYNGATGIAVNQGEEVVVFIDKVGNIKPQVLVQNLQHPVPYSYGGTPITLEPGYNKFTADRSGLIYIIYNEPNLTPNTTANPEIKFHFATGTVNGYYDDTNPKHAGRWRELLSKATNRYFDVLGKYSHMTMQTDDFRRWTPDLPELVSYYDKVVLEEQRLEGMMKYNRMFTNRALFLHDKSNGLYAINYYTAYGSGEPMFNPHGPNGFRRWNWGIGHEQGHQNQTYGLNWGGMVEITVNIPALYIEESVFGTESRSIAGNWFTNAWNDLLRGNASFSTKSQAQSSLMAFWQLELYFGRVLGRTPLSRTDHGGFYPDLYERLRDYPTPTVAWNAPNEAKAENNGIQQTNFAWHASLVAGYDLTDFFEKWGFFRTTTMELHLNTYKAPHYLTVTDAMVSDIKGKIRALGHAKPTVALEYITSENWEMYKNPKPVGVGTVSQSGNTFTLTGWQNVVAWEVRDATGTLLYTATGRTTKNAAVNTVTLDRAWNSSYVLNAIAADGTRTLSLIHI